MLDAPATRWYRDGKKVRCGEPGRSSGKRCGATLMIDGKVACKAGHEFAIEVLEANGKVAERVRFLEDDLKEMSAYAHGLRRNPILHHCHRMDLLNEDGVFKFYLHVNGFDGGVNYTNTVIRFIFLHRFVCMEIQPGSPADDPGVVPEDKVRRTLQSVASQNGRILQTTTAGRHGVALFDFGFKREAGEDEGQREARFADRPSLALAVVADLRNLYGNLDFTAP